MDDFSAVYDRIKFATNARTQVELASVLEIRQSSISDAKRRRSIPSEWYIKLHDKFGLSLNWLRKGEGSMFSASSKPGLGKIDVAGLPGPVPAGVPGHSGFYGESPDMLREDLPESTGVPTRILSTLCDWEDGGNPPVFTTLALLTLPAIILDENTLVFYLETSAMEPTLRRHAYVGISVASRRPISGEVYAILMPHEGVAFRRIMQDSENGYFLLCFDAPGMPSSRMPVKTLQARILGKVAWALQAV